MIGTVALLLVAVGLAVAQVHPLRRYRASLDMLEIVPEWRFYAQASMGAAGDLTRDTHLVVRDRDAAGREGAWTPVLWPAERRLLHGVWNPRARIDALVLSIAEDLAIANRRVSTPFTQQSFGYLVVPRLALEVPRAAPDTDRQFAIAHANGRAGRTLSIDFLSSWHR